MKASCLILAAFGFAQVQPAPTLPIVLATSSVYGWPEWQEDLMLLQSISTIAQPIQVTSVVDDGRGRPVTLQTVMPREWFDFKLLVPAQRMHEQLRLRMLAAPPVPDFDADGDVDMDDMGVMQRCFSGAAVPFEPHCAESQPG